MKVLDIDITEVLRDVLPVDSFLFNPSIAHIKDDIYLVSVRSYIHNIKKSLDLEPRLMKNPQHPWGTNWDGTDVTYILPMRITADLIEPMGTGEWPITVPVQDMRIFKFMNDKNHAVFILTFNERYEGDKDLLIKGGDSCDEYCYLINWSYLLVDHKTLDFSYLPGQKPMCMNVSNPVEKNWSLWTYKHRSKTYLMISYALTPTHAAFSLTLEGVEDCEIVGASTCRMISQRNGDSNIFDFLEKYYDNQLFVSLSTPSYEISKNLYRSIGHVKVKLNYIKKLAKSKERTPLAKFARKYTTTNKKHFNPNYIYLMFVYQFKVLKPRDKLDLSVDVNSGDIQMSGSDTRYNAVITHATPAFVAKVADYDYFLNFPSGMVITKEDTIISYGDGDASSHLLFIPNRELDGLLKPVNKLDASNYKFLHGEKDDDEQVTF